MRHFRSKDASAARPTISAQLPETTIAGRDSVVGGVESEAVVLGTCAWSADGNGGRGFSSAGGEDSEETHVGLSWMGRWVCGGIRFCGESTKLRVSLGASGN